MEDLKSDIEELKLVISKLKSWGVLEYQITKDCVNTQRWLNELLKIKKSQLKNESEGK